MTTPTTPPRLGEFERIARFFAPLAGPGALNLSDDVAVIDGPGETQYALTTDTIIEGVDFFPDDPPAMVAQKLLRVNLSDLAAKGAKPFGYLLTTALPRVTTRPGSKNSRRVSRPISANSASRYWGRQQRDARTGDVVAGSDRARRAR